MARHLTDVTEHDKKWIKKAARELGWKTYQVIELAIEKLREEKWEEIRKEIDRRKVENELNDILEQKTALLNKEIELQQKLDDRTPTAAKEPVTA